MNATTHRIALVVPALTDSGGVATVARFVKNAAIRSCRYEVNLVSLSTSSHDTCNLGLMKPSSWFQGPRKRIGEWDKHAYTHCGAIFGEVEFQRYKPRSVVTNLLIDCDLIQVVCGSPAWANAVIGLGKPVAVQCATRARVERHMRDRRIVSLAGAWRRAMTEITDRLDDRAIKGVDAIQVENRWMFEYAKKLTRGRKIDLRFAPPGVNTSVFVPSSNRSRFGNSYILCVGRLEDPRKNVGLLLEAYALLPSFIRQRVCLVLAGYSGPPNEFWVRAEQLGVRDQIRFLHNPNQSALVSLYQGATLFALPSDEEGLGVVLLEAMSCGVPVVSTRSGGPEDIVDDGKNGFLVARNDVTAFSERLRTLCTETDLNLGMGKHARGKVELRYSEVVTAQRFIDTWDRLLDGSTNGANFDVKKASNE